MKLAALADRLGARLEGDGDVEIVRVASIETAGAGDVTFVANTKYQRHLEGTRASAVILGGGLTHTPPPGCAVLHVENPYLAFAQAVEIFVPLARPAPGVHPTAIIGPDVTLGDAVSIGPFVVVGRGASIGARSIVEAHATIGDGARLGDDCWVRTHVAIRHGVSVGHRVILQDGVVLGSEGYGFVRLKDGTHYKIPQQGRLVVEDDVELGANTAVDRPAVGETRIGAGTKVDNLVQIAHGVSIGKRVLLASQVGISGSSTIEDDVVLAGQVGVAGHLTIGKGSVLGAQSGVPNDVPAGVFWTGYPSIDARNWRRSSILFKQLPELRKTIGELEEKIAALEEKLAAWETRPPR